MRRKVLGVELQGLLNEASPALFLRPTPPWALAGTTASAVGLSLRTQRRAGEEGAAQEGGARRRGDQSGGSWGEWQSRAVAGAWQERG